MSDLLHHLKRFNRKERFFLVGKALGKPAFALEPEFCAQVDGVLGTRIPDATFVAMDYHLDWLYASLFLHTNRDLPGPYDNGRAFIMAQQEDIDFLIAYRDEARYHVVLIEAKGDSAWGNQQMKSKADRFADIFGADGMAWPDVTPHFMLMSPRKPSWKLRTGGWPGWMLREGEIPWLELDMGDDLAMTSHCTEAGHPIKGGQFWTVVSRSRKRARQTPTEDSRVTETTLSVSID